MNPLTSRLSVKNIAFSAAFLVSFFVAGLTLNAQNHDEKHEGVVAAEVDTLEHEVINGAEHVAEEVTGHHESAEEKFNTSEVIMEHIADAHDWHLWGHTSIHLPVIVYINKGFEFLSSGKFEH